MAGIAVVGASATLCMILGTFVHSTTNTQSSPSHAPSGYVAGSLSVTAIRIFKRR